MKMSFWRTTAPIAVVATLIVLEIVCDGDVSYNARVPYVNNSNSWPKLPNQQNVQLSYPRSSWGSGQTTPWPALGQNNNRGPYQNQNTQNSNSNAWINRPNIQNQRPTSINFQNSNNRGSGPNFLPPGQQYGSSNNNRQTGNPNSVITDDELREFAETLLGKDSNNAAKHVTINYQGRTTSRSQNDEAPLPLLEIARDAYKIASIEKLMLLYNNYILESNQNEHYTAQEKTEESNLLDTILSTSVMQHTRNFLIEKGRIGRDPKEFKDILKEIWFTMYSRGGGRVGSSGFEHIFLAEIKNNQISGLHNWLYFNEEEKANQANYLGYLKKIDLGNKGAILKYHFKFHGIDKPVGSMFIGTSPELEMALYSTCFLLKADSVCPLKMNGNRFIIRTYTYRYRGKNMIGSAFPEI